jgi:hypothetical protein
MDSTLAWVIGGVVLVLAVWALVMGRRFGKGKVRLGKHISGEVEASTSGPTVREAEAYGENNTITAEGAGALTENTRAVGKGNVIGAKTTP